MYDVFVLLNTKEDILKNEGNRAILGHHYYFSYNGSQWCPKTAWLQTYQNIFLCDRQNKEIHTGLELLEGDSMMTEFSFLVNYPFKVTGEAPVQTCFSYTKNQWGSFLRVTQVCLRFSRNQWGLFSCIKQVQLSFSLPYLMCGCMCVDQCLCQ